MSTDNKITKDVREILHPQVVTRTNITTISSALVLILAGILAVILWSGAAGVIIIVVGALVYILKPKIEIYEPTGCHIKRHSYYIATEKRDSIIKTFEGELNDSVEPIMLLDSGGTRLDLLVSKDKSFLAWQIFHFVPHKYEPVSEMHTLTGPPAVQLERFISRSIK